MKLPILAAAGLLAFATQAAAQNPWAPWAEVTTMPLVAGFSASRRLEVNLPPDGSLWSLGAGNSGLGYVSAQLSSTSTGGATWRSRSFPAKSQSGSGPAYGQTPLTVWVLDSLHAWSAVYSYDSTYPTYSLWYTATGPAGLAIAPSQPPAGPTAAAFFTATAGFVVSAGSGALYRTTDGGQSWQDTNQQVALPLTEKPVVLGSTAWLLSGSSLLRSTDAGLTWSLSTLPVALRALAFRDLQHGLALTAAAGNSTVYRTADGGTTWTAVPPAAPVHWTGLATVPGTTSMVLAVGDPGPSYSGYSTAVSYDDGLTWQGVGGTRYVRSVVAASPGSVWAVSENEPGPQPAYYSGLLLRYAGTALATAATQPAPGQAAYPNPSTGRVYLPPAGAYQRATVYDATGRPCASATLQAAQSSLELGHLAWGTYLLRLAGGSAAPAVQRLVLLP